MPDDPPAPTIGAASETTTAVLTEPELDGSPVHVVEDRFPIDATAPAAARAMVRRDLGDAVQRLVLDRAMLVVSELVTNSVVHSGASDDAFVVLRIERCATSVRLEVEDPGCAGAIAPRAPDLGGGGGMGLNLVRGVAARWGIERAIAGGTRVWAQLAVTGG